MFGQAPIRLARPIAQRLENRTDWVKRIILFGFNFAGLVLATLIAPPPALGPFSFLEDAFPGALGVVGAIIGRILNACVNWSALRYLLVANFLAVIPFLFGAQFIRKLYRFDKFGLGLGDALDYLVGAFGVTSYYFVDPTRSGPTSPPEIQSSAQRFVGIKDGKLTPFNKNTRNKTIALAGGPGTVIVPPEYAVQLERGGLLSYVFGPGAVRLGRFEKVYKSIDLRQILRKNTVKVLTRDGIPVEVEVTIQARVHASNLPNNKTPYPFDRSAIRKLITQTPSLKSGPMDWEERPALLVGAVLNRILAKYRLDELFEPLEDDMQTPRPTLHDEIRRELRQMARNFGVDVTEVWLGDFQLPPDVTKQFLAYWKADWQRQDKSQEGRGEASAIRERNRARAEGQQQIIETLVASFQSVKDANLGVAPKQLIALRLIDGLEHLFRQTRSSETDEGDRVLMLERHLSRLRRTVQAEPAPERGEEQTEKEGPDATT